MKVSELEGAQLDYWVAKVTQDKAVSIEDDECWLDVSEYDTSGSGKTWVSAQQFSPSSNWLVGGPLIEKHIIHLDRDFINVDISDEQEWIADNGADDAQGSTPLIAAMRCIVKSKYGHKVEE